MAVVVMADRRRDPFPAVVEVVADHRRGLLV
jgi:hypothetical protein